MMHILIQARIKAFQFQTDSPMRKMQVKNEDDFGRQVCKAYKLQSSHSVFADNASLHF